MNFVNSLSTWDCRTKPRVNPGLGIRYFFLLVRKYGFKSSDGEEELRDAAQRGDVGEVKRLIESGVSVNSANTIEEVSSDCTCRYVNIQGKVNWSIVCKRI